MILFKTEEEEEEEEEKKLIKIQKMNQWILCINRYDIV